MVFLCVCRAATWGQGRSPARPLCSGGLPPLATTLGGCLGPGLGWRIAPPRDGSLAELRSVAVLHLLCGVDARLEEVHRQRANDRGGHGQCQGNPGRRRHVPDVRPGQHAAARTPTRRQGHAPGDRSARRSTRKHHHLSLSPSLSPFHQFDADARAHLTPTQHAPLTNKSPPLRTPNQPSNFPLPSRCERERPQQAPGNRRLRFSTCATQAGS